MRVFKGRDKAAANTTAVGGYDKIARICVAQNSKAFWIDALPSVFNSIVRDRRLQGLAGGVASSSSIRHLAQRSRPSLVRLQYMAIRRGTGTLSWPLQCALPKEERFMKPKYNTKS